MKTSWKKYWNQFQNWKYAVPTTFILVGIAFLATRLFHIEQLPVFADEAIYIRWAQLIQHEPQRYLFFSMNDGKPPLFIWIVSAFLELIPTSITAVWIARAIAAVIGLGQLFVTDRIVKQLQGTLLTRVAAAIIIFTAPFWTFHHRIGLMDGLLTLLLSISFWGLIGLHQTTVFAKKEPKQLQSQLGFAALAAIGFGLALWTKTPALFFAPVFVLIAFLGQFLLDELSWKKITWKWLLQRTLWFGGAGFVGLLIFLLLRTQPTFGSLFGRSSDFTYSLIEVIQSQGLIVWNNITRVLPWISTYLRPELVALAVISLAVSKYRRMHLTLWFTAAIFAAPLLLLGKTLHPRYFLPVAPFITLSAAFMAHEAWELVRKKESWEMALIFFTLLAFYLVGSLRFLFFSYYDTNQIPFVLHDREQYLTEWSSGHGLAETRDMIARKVQEGEYITVVTEGSFGSLPDGLLLYFDRMAEIESVRIEGLAQYPVKTIPDWVWKEAADHPTWLVVNEHRNALPQEVLDQMHLEATYPRPYGAPSLQVYELRPNNTQYPEDAE